MTLKTFTEHIQRVVGDVSRSSPAGAPISVLEERVRAHASARHFNSTTIASVVTMIDRRDLWTRAELAGH